MEKYSSESEKGIIHSIVPWVLPREDIPIRIEIPNGMNFDKIRIRIPPDFKFIHFINVEGVEITENIAIIENIFKTKLVKSPTYFGLVVTSTEIPEKLKTLKQIFVEIFLNGKIIEEITLNARIFRPKLEVTDIVQEIELTEDVEEYKVPMNLKYVGFGDVKLKIQGQIKGQIVSHGDSLINELLRRIWFDSQETREKNEAERRMDIEQQIIEDVAKEIEKKVNEGDVSDISDIIGEDIDINAFKELFSNFDKKRFLNVIYTRIEDIFIDLLADTFEKHPTESVQLTDSQTNIRADIDSKIEIITTHLYYKDSLDNEYPPLERSIKIIDNRKERTKTTITMPMVIEKWEEEPFINVADMKLEGEK